MRGACRALFGVVAAPLVLAGGALVVRAETTAAHDVGRLRDEARAALSSGCGSCHTKSWSGAKPAALEVFDLAERDWHRRMTDAQLPKLSSRMDGFGAAAADKKRVAAFVRAELARRATAKK